MADETPTPNDGAATLENKPEHPRDAKPWRKMIEAAEKAFDKYQTVCDALAKDYADLTTLASSMGEREYQMLYANMEVVKPSIYSRPPQPVVVPRFKDREPVPRKASELMERALVTSFDVEKVHDTLLKARDDLALFARGVVWQRFDLYAKDGKPKECVKYDWLYRRDFLHEPARVWSEVGWVARGTWMTLEKGMERFGGAWAKAAVTYEAVTDTGDEYKVEQKARVWELWHKEQNVVVWLTLTGDEVLDIAEPHLTLEGFFPCPKPAFGTCMPGTLIPVPDACFYKDQLEEINELTARISALSESLKLVGFYAAGTEDLGDAIETALKLAERDNRRIAVPLAGMSQFGQGALKDAIVWLPVVEVANTVKELVALRQQLQDDVFQISGISDIMRGDTAASETLGAQQLKSQYGSIRIKDRQSEMVRLCDALLNIAGEIMAENFSPETLMEMSQTTDLPKQADVLAQHQQAMQAEIQAAVAQVQQGVAQGQPAPDQQQIMQARDAIVLKHQKEAEKVVTIEKVFGLLRSQRTRPFILQIATDSTIQPDENAEKKARSEFATAFAQMTTALGPIVQVDPAGSADFAGEMVKFVLAPFRAGRPMEQAVDDWVEQMKAKAKEPPPPNPEQIKMEAEAKARDMDMKVKAADLEDKKAERAEKARATTEQAALKRDEQMAANADRQAERQHKKEMADIELAMKRLDKELKELEANVRQIEAGAKGEDAEDKQVERETKRLTNAKAKAELDEVGHRQRKAANEGDAAMFVREEAAGRLEQTRAVTEAVREIQMGMSQLAAQQASLVRAMTAPKQIIRDPKTQRAVGVQTLDAGV